MIGDRIDNDIIPANEIGMKTVWVKQGYGKYWSFSSDTESQKAEKADFEVDNLSGLLKILSDDFFLKLTIISLYKKRRVL